MLLVYPWYTAHSGRAQIGLEEGRGDGRTRTGEAWIRSPHSRTWHPHGTERGVLSGSSFYVGAIFVTVADAFLASVC